MLMVTHLVDPIRSPFWIYEFIRWNFKEKITELALDIIAKSLYVQCDVHGNEYHLLEAFINHRKNGSAFSGEDQRKDVKGKKHFESQQLVGTFVVIGRMAPHYGRSYPTQSRLQNVP